MKMDTILNFKSEIKTNIQNKQKAEDPELVQA